METTLDVPPMGGELGVLQENILELRSLYNQFRASSVKDDIERHAFRFVNQAERKINARLDDAAKGAAAISTSHEKLKAKVEYNWRRHRASVKALEAAVEKLTERVAALESATVPVVGEGQMIDTGTSFAILSPELLPSLDHLGGFTLHPVETSETAE